MAQNHEEKSIIKFTWWHYFLICPAILLYSITPISSLNYYVPITPFFIFTFLWYFLNRSKTGQRLDFKKYVLIPTGIYFLGDLSLPGLYAAGLLFVPISLVPFIAVIIAGLMSKDLHLPRLKLAIPIFLLGMFMVWIADSASNKLLVEGAGELMATGRLSTSSTLAGRLMTATARIFATIVFMSMMRLNIDNQIKRQEHKRQLDEAA